MSVEGKGRLPYSLYRAEQVRALDREAIEGCGIPGYSLMSRAGEAAFRLLSQRWEDLSRITVVCGVGNNGGDGFVVARLAREAGLEVRVLQVGDTGKIRGDARTALDAWLACGGRVEPFAGQLPSPAGVVVDALLGTGLEREVTGEWLVAVQAMSEAPGGALAIDIPSGLHSDSGRVLGAAVHARHTVSFIGLKRGLFTGAGPACGGELHFDDLGVPPRIYSTQALSAQRLTVERCAHLLSPRPRIAHKGDCGHVLVVGGECGFSGAARMAAEAAARSGAGLVSVATRAQHAGLLGLTRPELMCHGIESVAELDTLLAQVSVVAVGPGLGRGEWGRLMLEAVADASLPTVVDADALNLLAEKPRRCDNWILTPHPGEAGRLLGMSSSDVQADRFDAARSLWQRFGGVVVLKGAGTVIEAGTGPAGVCQAGNPGMASGGMGDVLTGVIAGLLAQGLAPVDAARAGACVHGQAADLVAMESGERGMLALDLMPHIRRLVNPAI